LLSGLQDQLEEIAQFDLLLPTIGCLTFLAKHFTALIKKHFEDIVDLLIGWRLDPTLPHNVVEAINGK
jgi:hypothetical protein